MQVFRTIATIAGAHGEFPTREPIAQIREIRRIVAERELDKIQPGSVEEGVIRGIAADWNLPAQLKGWSKATGIAVGILGGVALWPATAATATVLGAAISIGSIFYDGSLPKSLVKVKWARWAMEWKNETK